MSLADVAGVAVYDGRIVVPFTGLWHASLTLFDEVTLTGPQTLTVQGVTWLGAVIRSIVFTGRTGVRLVAGKAGWRQTIPSKQYGALPPATVAVLTDAAAACGEPTPVVDPSLPQYVGAAYVRAEAPASTVLDQVIGVGWWADRNGIVQTSARAGAVVSPFQATKVSGAVGWYEIATDSPQDWTPGATFTGPTVQGTISRVEHHITSERVRTRVLVP